MSRRASLLGADLLFGPSAPRLVPEAELREQGDPTSPADPAPAVPRAPRPRRPRHEEKITVYCTAEDLTRLEGARLELRSRHGVAADRGRIVRAAVAEMLEDFEQRGSDSRLVRRLAE